MILWVYSIIFDRLSKNGKTYLEDTTKHLNEYGDNGLRTLALAYKKLEESEFSDWNNEFLKAKSSIGSDRDVNLERVSDMMERDLVLVGATAVEDKLQKGVCLCFVSEVQCTSYILHPTFCIYLHFLLMQVPECIDKLAQAGLKIWVLTGDKMETAINIGCVLSSSSLPD